MKKLENGVDFNCNNNPRRLKFFVIMSVFDKPAKAEILNIINSTGYFGCLKCLQEGICEETCKGGTRRIFCFNIDDPTGPKRTSESYAEHVDLAETSNRTFSE